MQTYITSPFILSLIFLIGFGYLTVFSSSLVKLGKYQSNEKLKITRSKLFFFRSLLYKFFKKNEWENLYFCIGISKNILILLYAFSAFFFGLNYLAKIKSSFDLGSFQTPLIIGTISLIIIAISILTDFVMRLASTLLPIKTTRFSLPIASIYLVILSPITFTLLKIIRVIYQFAYQGEAIDRSSVLKQRVKEILSDTEKHLDPYEQKLISSFITFRERVAREIMVPRVDICALPSNISIKEATPIFIEEGYSRIPIYKDTLDHIIGVILHKDVLKIYSETEKEKINLESPLEKLLKPVIYAPENKKISHLLQEFKVKQTHLAIIVNEYGGTEGIVTIEDVLEELVGEIEDESDVEEDQRYWKLPDGGYIINAKMSIVDIADELNIKIPPHPEYETIGGFVFHKAGTIPQKGWIIHLDEFQLKVLSSDERSIKKILVTPT